MTADFLISRSRSLRTGSFNTFSAMEFYCCTIPYLRTKFDGMLVKDETRRCQIKPKVQLTLPIRLRASICCITKSQSSAA